MKICYGKERSDGTIPHRVIGESREGETAKQAIERIALRYLGIEELPKKARWQPNWSRLGPRDAFDYLPCLWIGRKHFSVDTDFDVTTQTYKLA